MARLLSFAAAVLVPSVAAAAGPGDVVITELMIRSSSAPEWVEVHNPGAISVDLGACQLIEGGTSAPLTGVVVPPGSRSILSKGADCVVFDAGGTCLIPSLDDYGSVTLADHDPGTVRIDCGGTVVDEVSFDWDLVEPDCTSAATCSVNVDPSRETAAANDDWAGAWCVPPASATFYDALGREAVGTPGAANLCPEEGPACGVGSAVITEILVDAPSSSGEWFEVLLVDACDLHGCTILEGPFADATTAPTDESWTRHTIDAASNSLGGAAGTRLLLAESATVVGPKGPGALEPADYEYGAITFSNTEPGYLHLVCGSTVVDSAPYDLAQLAPACPGESCTQNLPPTAEDAVSNDDLARWCLPPAEATHVDGDGNPFRGTPGAPGLCLARAWPNVGDVVVSEVMVAPITLGELSPPEWFELWNRGEAAVSLDGCSLLLSPDDGAGAPARADGSRLWLPPLAGAAPLPPGEAAVFASERCLDGTTVLPCEGAEQLYDGLSFTNDGRFWLELECPTDEGGTFVIDTASWDLGWSGTRAGHSLQIDSTASAGAEANDEPASWCEAPFDACYARGEGQECNYGAPYAVSPCPTPPTLPGPGPGCHCAASAADPRLPWLMSLSVWPLLRRRNRR